MPGCFSSYIPLQFICVLALSLCLVVFFSLCRAVDKILVVNVIFALHTTQPQCFCLIPPHGRVSFACALKHKNIYARLFCSVMNRKYALQNEKYFIIFICLCQCPCHVCLCRCFLSLSIYTIFSASYSGNDVLIAYEHRIDKRM